MECLVLETARTKIRQIKESDFTAYFQLENNHEVMRFISGKGRNLEEARKRFDKQRKEYLCEPGFGVWVVCMKNNEEIIGTVNLNFIPATSIRQIGYKLSPAAQGKGLASELAVGLLHYGFKVLGLTEISAICHPENIASEKVMQKAEMHFIEKGWFYESECLHYRIDSASWFRKSG